MAETPKLTLLCRATCITKLSAHFDHYNDKISTTESSTQRVDFYHAQVRSGGCSSRPEDEHQSRYHILEIP
ncbi:hypothetical protein JCGZ_05314 [Jatropha curcas]|uniref:Uncharacterized protein n=1 Tax=Jatropha curcas TaxID=180498 RepID=A0A067KR32_JATCU|nr:hypothetical protein JCGZ_05314 [Jatropha curcas]